MGEKKKIKLNGIVISNKMNKTLVVKAQKTVKHPKYKKLVKRYTKFFVHDENNECAIGDLVFFKEVAPISKKKHWILCSVYKKEGNSYDSNAI